MSSIVKLNVGGTVFATSRTTLTRFEGFFRDLFETDVPLEKDDAGCIFIDRSPKHFDLILNYMRGCDVEITKDHKEVMEEAQFYLLDGLFELCRTALKPEQPCANEVPIIESDAQFLRALAVQQKPILLLDYLCGRTLIPQGFDFIEFTGKYSHQFEIYFNKFGDSSEWGARIIPKNAGATRNLNRNYAKAPDMWAIYDKIHGFKCSTYLERLEKMILNFNKTRSAVNF